jgi:hypothetical protein
MITELQQAYSYNLKMHLTKKKGLVCATESRKGWAGSCLHDFTHVPVSSNTCLLRFPQDVLWLSHAVHQRISRISETTCQLRHGRCWLGSRLYTHIEDVGSVGGFQHAESRMKHFIVQRALTVFVSVSTRTACLSAESGCTKVKR